VVAGGDVEAVGDEEGDQGEPEHHVEDHRRADPLGAEGEPGVRPADSGLGQQAVAQGRPGGGASGGHVAEGQGGHVDPEQTEPSGPVVGEDGVGQLGVRGEGGDLQQDTEGQVGDVDVGEGVDLPPMTGQKGEGDVEDEEEDEERPHAPPHLTADKGAPVPPAGVGGPRLVGRWGSHLHHVGTREPSDLTC